MTVFGDTLNLRQPLGEVESRSVLARRLSSRLESTPVRLVDTDLKRNQLVNSHLSEDTTSTTHLKVIIIVRVRVRDNLPIHPRNPALANLIRVLLDVSIPCPRRQRIPRRAVVVRSVEVAHAPLLHHQLLAGVLRSLHDGLEFGLRQVAETVGVDGDHVEGCAGEVGFLDRGVDVGGAAGGDEDVGAALEVAFDGAGDVALPVCEGVGVFLCLLVFQVLVLMTLEESADLHSHAWPHSASRKRRCTPGSATRAFRCED
jgi:hypothetical protein